MFNQTKLMSIGELKASALKMMADHTSYFRSVFIISSILLFPFIVSAGIALGSTPYTFLIIFTNLLLTGGSLTAIDAFRGQDDFKAPFDKSFSVFDSFASFTAFIVIRLWTAFFVFLWSLLFIIPGIVQAIAYSQAFYIYRDHIKHGRKESCLVCIAQSKTLMRGHKWDYAMLLLSFIGWGFLNIITVGVSLIWVNPYFRLSLANFYVNLVNTEAPQLASPSVIAS